MDLKLLSIFVLVSVVLRIEAFSSGAPYQKCENMQPSPTAHGEPQTSSSPYKLTVREQIIKSGDTVQLDIEKIDSAAPDFKGFIVQGRNAKNPDVRVGSFVVKDDDPNVKKQDGCEKGSVTHKTGVEKNNVTVLWKSPIGINEPQTVEFKFTIVQYRYKHWVKTIGSNNVEVQVNKNYNPSIEPEPEGESEPEPEASSEPSSKSNHPVYQGCHENKGCFGVPDNCVSKGTCIMMMTYKHENAKLNMQLYASQLGSGQYVAVGFSNDQNMGDDLVYSCSNGRSTVNTHWNNGRNNEKLNGVEIKDVKVETKDGATVCEFIVPEKVMARGNIFDITSTQYNILLAKGQGAGQALSYHGQNRFPSGSKADFTSVNPVGVASKSYLIQVHGVMMIVAWIFCATIGMMFARYYKETWRQVKPAGKDLWFRVHQLLMGFTVVISFASFWVILSSVGFFPYTPADVSKNPHPILGAICIILALIQPIMAFFRPHPGMDSRWIFDWAHWLCGNAAFMLGVVAIFFAAELESANLPKTVTGIMLAFVVVHVVIHLSLTVQKKWVSSNGVKDSFTVNNDALSDLSGSPIRKMLIVFYITFVFCITIALCFMIFKNVTSSGSGAYSEPQAEPGGEPEGEPE